jgi:hypothetical protein
MQEIHLPYASSLLQKMQFAKFYGPAERMVACSVKITSASFRATLVLSVTVSYSIMSCMSPIL